MRDLAPIIAAACGLGVVCVGLIVIGGFMLVRVTGQSFLGPLFSILGGGGGNEELPEDRPVPTMRAQSSSRDLRSLAQSLDFDAAVQKYRQQGGVQNPPDPNYTPGPAPAPLEADPTKYDIRGTYSRQPNNLRNRRNEDEGQEEFLGGLFGAEDNGDGDSGLF
jgi:hypothetical protein